MCFLFSYAILQSIGLNEVFMDTRRCLESVAQHEFNTLAQDTKRAINGLKRQRQSVVQAIEAARQVDGQAEHAPDDKDALLTSLLEQLYCLSDALDRVVCEVEQIEGTPASSRAQSFIVVPLTVTQEA
jgi:ABC-type transporter Mla subunit MlaD